MTMYDDRTVFEKMRGTRIPDYYDQMWRDNFSVTEIMTVLSNDLYEEAMKRRASLKPSLPTNITIQMEVLQK